MTLPLISTKVSNLDDLAGQMLRYKRDGIEIIKIYAGISMVASKAVIAVAHKCDNLGVTEL